MADYSEQMRTRVHPLPTPHLSLYDHPRPHRRDGARLNWGLCTATYRGLQTVHAESIQLYAARYSSRDAVQVTVEGTRVQLNTVHRIVQRDIVTL